MREVRAAKIRELLKEKGNVKVGELARLFGTSDITIHRDLSILESEGVLKRTRGGAVAVQMAPEYRYPNRVLSNLREKEMIANSVVSLINEGDTIILDGSTTNITIARQLRDFNDLTIYSMSPYITNELLDAQGVLLYSMGGLFSREMMHLIGSWILDTVGKLQVDKCVIGASAISCEHGITGPYLQLTSIQRAIIAISGEVILAADHSKYGRTSMEKVADIEQIDYLVVDCGIDEKHVDFFKAKTNLIIAR